MALTLTPCPLFDQSSTGHYSEDNARITQLNTNDQLIAAQLNALGSASTSTYTSTGSWATINCRVIFPTALANNTSFSIRVKMWGIEDTTSGALQNAFLSEHLVFGYMNSSGIPVIVTQSPLFIQNAGNKTVAVTFTVISNELRGTVAGLTGSTGKLVSRIEYFN